EQLPLAVAHDRLTQYGEQPIVKLFQLLVSGFVWASAQMRGNAFLTPLELTLVEETQPWGQERDDGRGFMNSWRKRGGRPRLVVIFQKAGQLVLVIEPGVEMLTHRPGMSIAQAVVEPFVICVIEPLLLQPPFHVPLDLRPAPQLL